MSNSVLNGGSKTLVVGIAGYGTVGKIRHRCIDNTTGLEVVAVCDQDFAEAEEIPGIKCWTSYKQLLQEPLDVVFVCLPNYLTAEVTVAALEQGLHVFCEKPPGRSPADVVRVRATEAEHPECKLMYGFNHRYHDSVRDAQQLIDSGELGELIDLRGVYGKSAIIRFDSDWRTKRETAGGGILLDQGIHMVDMMRLFAGEFTDIHSFISNGHWNHDVEDNAYALMRTDDGVVAVLHSSATQWRHRFSLDITLSRGAINLAGILANSKSYGSETITIVYAGKNDGGDPCEQMTRYNEDHSWQDEVSEFADLVLNDRTVEYGSSAEALATMELVYDIYCSDTRWAERFDLEPSKTETCR